MLVPPEGLKKKGYRIWTVGDDIAWMRIDTDGQLWAINPETGFFGVAPGTSTKTNPNMMKTIARNTIYTNVVKKPDGTVWWEGHDDEPPAEASDWKGNPWTPDMVDDKGNRSPALIPTAASRLLWFNALRIRFAPSITTGSPFRRLSSAVGGRIWRPWSTKRSTGSTARSSAPRWVRNVRPPSLASRAKLAATRWPCCRSAGTTWASISSIGWRWDGG
jgi:hypothetical protein